MAKACLDDIKACNEKPIGNGPYKIDGAWEHKRQIKLVRNDDYAGRQGQGRQADLQDLRQDVDTGYADFQAGELDVMRHACRRRSTRRPRRKYGDRMSSSRATASPTSASRCTTPNFKDKQIRQAISMAIDRQAIIDAVFDGRFTPAKGVVAVADSRVPGRAPASTASSTPRKAKALLAEAGGWKGGKLELWFNAGAGHEQWVQAVGDQIKKNLGIDYELKGNLQFAEYLATADAKKFTGPFRLGWGPDYPCSRTT